MFESGSVSQRCLVCTGRQGVFSDSLIAYIPFPINTILYWMYTNIFLSFSKYQKNPQKVKLKNEKKKTNPSKTKKRPKEKKITKKEKTNKQTKTIQVYTGILVLNIIMVNWSNICLVYTSTSISIYSKAQKTHFLYMRFMYHCITWNGIIKMSFFRGK